MTEQHSDDSQKTQANKPGAVMVKPTNHSNSRDRIEQEAALLAKPIQSNTLASIRCSFRRPRSQGLLFGRRSRPNDCSTRTAPQRRHLSTISPSHPRPTQPLMIDILSCSPVDDSPVHILGLESSCIAASTTSLILGVVGIHWPARRCPANLMQAVALALSLVPVAWKDWTQPEPDVSPSTLDLTEVSLDSDEVMLNTSILPQQPARSWNALLLNPQTPTVRHNIQCAADSEKYEDVIAQSMPILDPCSDSAHALSLPSACPLTTLGLACVDGCSFEAYTILVDKFLTHTCTSTYLPLVTLTAIPDTKTERDDSESDEKRRLAEAAQSNAVWGKDVCGASDSAETRSSVVGAELVVAKRNVG
ncbi:hypothetical protein BLNAU_1579 [Blattamonas nauphoetae]|uniref:Uncharacterized protein n=1 Tax=Blattamonas nauphoetae TaxID=2049346 RepID=A0ABQ9YIF4_9EUKA|nr:hypothetical protein BLNAU_1579 [Blattamonas nauphoetae]